MALTIDINKQHRFELPSQKDVDTKTTFLLKTLSKRKILKLIDESQANEGKGDNERMFNILLECIVGWEGLKDGAGVDIPFTQATVEPVLDALTMADVTALYEAVLSLNKIGDQDQKNSQ